MHSRERIYCIEVSLRLLQHYELILANSNFNEEEYNRFMRNFTGLIGELSALLDRLPIKESNELITSEEYRDFFMRWLPDKSAIEMA
jgi:hypothetical protein